MWQYVTEHIPAVLTAVASVGLGVLGAAKQRKWRPRRLTYTIAGFFVSKKEREMILWTQHQWQERAVNAEAWAAYWKTQAEQCLTELHKDRS